MLYHIYFNGSFYYVSTDTHYKHGRPIISSWDETTIKAQCESLNLLYDLSSMVA